MELLYLDEHLACKHYDRSVEPRMQYIEIEKENDWSFYPEEGKIIFIMKGKLSFSYGDYSNRVASEGEFFHLPPGYRFTSNTIENTSIIIIRMYSQMRLCDCFTTDSLIKEEMNDKDVDIRCLKMNKLMWVYLESLKHYIDTSFKCTFLLELKIRELFFLLRGFYNREELLQFFYLHLTNDVSFSEFIHQNYHKAKTAQDLANLANYSLSGLQKRFKKVFGMSVYNWMLGMKAKNMLQDINNTNKAFKEISDMYGFSSPAHFSNFCKVQFNATPTQIRKKGIVVVQNLSTKRIKG